MFEELTTPISEAQPTGEYLKDNRQLYRSYRNLFNVAQSSFRQLLETPDALDDAEAVKQNADNWLALGNECSTCLSQHSKDVEIFSWFAMAQLFTHDPFNNLASALSTFEVLVDQYWDQLQPTLPEKKRKGSDEAEQAKSVIEHRIKPMLQLVGDTADSGLLYRPLQMLPLVGDIDYGNFFSAEKGGTLPQLKEQAAGFFASEQSELTDKLLALDKALHSLEAVEKSISDKCFAAGVHPISFKFVKESVERLIAAIRYLVGDNFAHWPLDPQVEEQPEQAMSLSDASVEGGSDAVQVEGNASSDVNPAAISTAPPLSESTPLNMNASINNREHALNELQKIADYFLATEPHSPIYLLLKRAIRWGGMSLPELLEELVGDNGSVHQRIEQLAGLESAEHKANLAPAPAPNFPLQDPVPEVREPEQEPESSSSTIDNPGGGLTQIEW